MTDKSTYGILSAIAKANALVSDGFTRNLCDTKVRGIKATDKTMTLPDGGGMDMYIPPSGKKVWRYRFRLNGAQQVLTIGGYPEISLADARGAHRGSRWLVERGVSPLAHVKSEIDRMNEEEQRQRFNTFGVVCAKWLDDTQKKVSPRTDRHRRAMLGAHVLPALGQRPMSEIRRRELLNLLRPLDEKHPITGRHCRLYIKAAFDWAVRNEIVQGNPTPASKDLSNQEAHEPTPRKALPLSQIGLFLRTLKEAPDTDPQTKIALQLIILTWCRTSEITAARWSEVNLDAGIWTIPAGRMKAGRDHSLYLSSQAVSLLREVRQWSGASAHVFPNRRRPDDHMSRMTLSNWRKRHGFAEIMDVHGFRATASTWANEIGKHRPDVIETALAHKEGDKVRAAYNRSVYMEELRLLWQDWADLLDEKEAVARSENVVEFARSAA